MDHAECITCPYYRRDPANPIQGFCHAEPPQVFFDPEGNLVSSHPPVQGEGHITWCRHHPGNQNVQVQAPMMTVQHG